MQTTTRTSAMARAHPRHTLEARPAVGRPSQYLLGSGSSKYLVWGTGSHCLGPSYRHTVSLLTVTLCDIHAWRQWRHFVRLALCGMRKLTGTIAGPWRPCPLSPHAPRRKAKAAKASPAGAPAPCGSVVPRHAGPAYRRGGTVPARTWLQGAGEDGKCDSPVHGTLPRKRTRYFPAPVPSK